MTESIKQDQANSASSSTFLSNLQMFGTPALSLKRSQVIDPLPRMKSTFKSRAQTQIEILNSNNQHDGRCWFKHVSPYGNENGYFIACLRNGTRTLPLPGASNHLKVETSEDLAKFFREAIDACERGELDHLFQQAMPKRKEIQ